MATKNRNENTVETMENGVPRDDHKFMRVILCNDEVSTDEELQEHFVSEGIIPQHAAQYIKHRTRYLNEFCIKDDGTLRFPFKTEKDGEEFMKLEDKFY